MTIVSAPDSRLQQRIYERLCLTGAIVVGVVSVPTNILQGLPWIVTLLAALFGALSLGFYLASRRGYWYPAAYLGLMLVVINSIWFPNGGVLGSTPYFLLPAAGYAVIFFRGAARVAWVSGIALDAVGLCLAELWRPTLVTAYPSESAHVIDTLAGFGFSLLLTAIMSWVVSDGYDEERRQNAAALGARSHRTRDLHPSAGDRLGRRRAGCRRADAFEDAAVEQPAGADARGGVDGIFAMADNQATGSINAVESAGLPLGADKKGIIISTDAPVTNYVGEVPIGWFAQHWGKTYLGWASNYNTKDLQLTEMPK